MSHSRHHRTLGVFVAVAAAFSAGAGSASAAAVSVGLQTNPAIEEESPAATATYQAWEQNSVSSPGHWNVYAVPRAGGAVWKVNARRTAAYTPSPVTGGTETFIYQQARGNSSNLYLYNPTSRTRRLLPAKVDSTAWEYYGVASTKYVAFMRLTSRARTLLLYNRSSGRITQVASSRSRCGLCLEPNWVGTSHLAYTVYSPRTNTTNVRVLTIGGSTVTVPRQSGPSWDNYGASMAESTGDIYFAQSTIYCGLFVSIARWNLGGGIPTSVYDLPEGIDLNSVSLAPDTATPGNLDALYSQYDCLAQNSDNYELQSVNTLPAAPATHRADGRVAHLTWRAPLGAGTGP